MDPEDKDDFRDEDGCPDPDNDQDGIADQDDSCPNDAEIINGVEDKDGCPDEGLITFVDDRVVLEERVLFDFNRSRVKHSARPVLQAIVELWRQHPEWNQLRVEGHADVRGDPEWNQELSEMRAQRVRNFLVSLGIPGGTIEAVGFGASKPRDNRDTGDAHQRNRRVEFVVLSRHPAPGQEEVPDANAQEKAAAADQADPEVGAQGESAAVGDASDAPSGDATGGEAASGDEEVSE